MLDVALGELVTVRQTSLTTPEHGSVEVRSQGAHEVSDHALAGS